MRAHACVRAVSVVVAVCVTLCVSGRGVCLDQLVYVVVHFYSHLSPSIPPQEEVSGHIRDPREELSLTLCMVLTL